MPPEQASGDPARISPAADIYALGAILYCLLTGRPPFRGANNLETLKQVLEQDPVPPQQLNRAVATDLETICLKCLEKNPGNRYATAADLSADLGRFLRGEPVTARPVTRAERFVRWVIRRPAIAAAWALLLLTLILGSSGGVAFWQWLRADAALVIAKHERKVADTQRGIADQQRKLAEKLAKEEQKQRGEAEKQRGRAEKLAKEEKKQRGRAEQLVHVGEIRRAQAAWDEGDARLAWHLLNATRAEYRGWEFDYLYTLFNQNQRTFRGHMGEVNSVCFSPDGKQIISGSDDGTVKIWDASSGEVELTLRGHTGIVNCVAISVDGLRIASGSHDCTVKLWDAIRGIEQHTLRGHSDIVLAVAISPDGKRIISSSQDKTVKIWDASSGEVQRTLRGHTHYILGVAISPDGERIVSSDYDGNIKLWDASNGDELRTFKGRKIFFDPRVPSFSPDGKRIIGRTGQATVKIWDASNGNELLRLKGSVASFSPDGKRIVSAAGRTVMVWNAQNGRQQLMLEGHTASVTAVVFSRDGKLIASESTDQSLRIWDATTGQELLMVKGRAVGSLQHGNIAFSPGGERILSLV